MTVVQHVEQPVSAASAAARDAVVAALPVSVGKPDPRTLLLAVVIINLLVMSTASLTTAVLCALVVIAAHASAGLNRTTLSVAVSLTVFAVLFWVGRAFAGNPLVGFVSMCSYWFFRFGAAIAGALYMYWCVTPGELTAALYRMRVPRVLTIPLIVMLRFFPLARGELVAVTEASALRGLPLGAWSWVRHPLRSMEYVLVPMLASCSRIADDLTSSGTVRGLGGEERPTSIVPVRFGWPDLVVVLVVGCLVAQHLAGVEWVTV